MSSWWRAPRAYGNCGAVDPLCEGRCSSLRSSARRAKLRGMRSAVGGGLLLVAGSLSRAAFADPAAPPRPGLASSADRASSSSPRSDATGQNAARPSDPRQGIVRLERADHPIGYGFVLRGDGRILTALSALGHGNFVRARFADDGVLAVRVVAVERTWDLALLAPEGGRWTLGLRASATDAAAGGVHLRRFLGRGRALQEADVAVAARQTLLGRDGALLPEALLFAGRIADDEIGSPICDEGGEVVAVLAEACDPRFPRDCRLAPFGVPVAALKQFLRSAPPHEALPAAWTGLRGIANHSGAMAGVRVVAIEPGSPAERAGLAAPVPSNERRADTDLVEPSGDLIVAVNDLPVTTPEELRDLINRIVLTSASRAAESGARAPTETKVRLLVYGGSRYREVELTLSDPRPRPATPDAAPNVTPGALPEGTAGAPPAGPADAPSEERPAPPETPAP
jgi:serine protease Do